MPGISTPRGGSGRSALNPYTSMPSLDSFIARVLAIFIALTAYGVVFYTFATGR